MKYNRYAKSVFERGNFMIDNEKLDIYFYAYALYEVLLTWLGSWLLTKGISIIFIVLVLQIIGHIYIILNGIRLKKYETYRLYFGLVLPFIMLSFMLWYNTF